MMLKRTEIFNGVTTFSPYHVPVSIIFEQWPQANLEDPVRRHGYLPYGSILQAVSTVVTVARLWARADRSSVGWGHEDTLVLLAWICATGMYSLAVHGILNAGLGYHAWDLVGVVPSPIVKAGVVAWSIKLLFLWSMCFIKTSVLLFFERLLCCIGTRTLTWWIRFGVAVNVLSAFAFSVDVIRECTPIRAAWESLSPLWPIAYHCADKKAAELANGILSIVTDLYAIAIPVYVVQGLCMKRTTKLILSGILGLGFLVTAATAMRMYYLRRMYTDELRDLTWVGYDVLTWASIETQLALICASIPVMRCSLRRAKRTASSFHRSYSSLGLAMNMQDTGVGTQLHSRSKLGRIPKRLRRAWLQFSTREVAEMDHIFREMTVGGKTATKDLTEPSQRRNRLAASLPAIHSDAIYIEVSPWAYPRHTPSAPTPCPSPASQTAFFEPRLRVQSTPDGTQFLVERGSVKDKKDSCGRRLCDNFPLPPALVFRRLDERERRSRHVAR